MASTIEYGVPFATRATNHDCIEPDDHWQTVDGKPLEEGHWYGVVVTRAEGAKRATWRFLTGPCDSEEAALSALPSAQEATE